MLKATRMGTPLPHMRNENNTNWKDETEGMRSEIDLDEVHVIHAIEVVARQDDHILHYLVLGIL